MTPAQERVEKAFALADSRVLVTNIHLECPDTSCGASIAKRQDALVVLAAEIRRLRSEVSGYREALESIVSQEGSIVCHLGKTLHSCPACIARNALNGGHSDADKRKA